LVTRQERIDDFIHEGAPLHNAADKLMPAGLSGPPLHQFDDALCPAYAGKVQKHLGQGVVSHVAT